MKLSTPAKVGIGLGVAGILAIALWPKKAKAEEAAGGGDTGGKKPLTGESFDKNTNDAVSIDAIVAAATDLPLKVGESFWLKARDGSMVTTITTDGVTISRPTITTNIDTGKGVGLIAIAPGAGMIKGTFATDLSGTDEHDFDVPYIVTAA